MLWQYQVTKEFELHALPCMTERQVFEHLKLDYVPPHLRILESWTGEPEATNKQDRANQR